MTLADVGLLVLRLGIGLIFAAHGAQKAFGWWGGPGPERWHGAMERMGFRPTALFAAISIGVELVGGLLLAVGFLTPFAGAALIGQAVVIIVAAHWSKGFFNTGGGYEFPLALGIVAIALTLMAAGAISLDGVAGFAWSPTVRIVLTAIGLVGGAVAALAPRVASERAAAHEPTRSGAGNDPRSDARNDLRRT